jgi:hypothetical protein
MAGVFRSGCERCHDLQNRQTEPEPLQILRDMRGLLSLPDRTWKRGLYRTSHACRAGFVLRAWRRLLSGHSQATSAPYYLLRYRSALTALLEMRCVDAQSKLSEEDWGEYQRLCLPESPDFIMDLPDCYAFFTYSMFRGRFPRMNLFWWGIT